MDLRIFPNAPLVALLGTVEEVGDKDLVFLAKKPRSQRRTRMVVPIKDIGWAHQGGSKLENHPDILYLEPTAFRQEPTTYLKDVDIVENGELRTFQKDNRTITIFNENLVRVSCQEDVATESEKKKQPKAARARGKAKAKKTGRNPIRAARKRRAAASDDDFE